MYHSGIGGGGFMMVRDAKGNYEAIDFRESAPESAFEEMYHDNVDGSVYGGLSAGVPSEVAGLEYAHRKYGVGHKLLFLFLDLCAKLISLGPALENYYGRCHTSG